MGVEGTDALFSLQLRYRATQKLIQAAGVLGLESSDIAIIPLGGGCAELLQRLDHCGAPEIPGKTPLPKPGGGAGAGAVGAALA